MALTTSEHAMLDAAWQRAEDERDFWDAQREMLMRQYPEEFVAVVKGEVVAHGPNLVDLVQQIGAAGHDVRTVWIEFLATDHHKFLL